MVGLPRRHQKLGANLGRSDDMQEGRAISQTGAICNVASNKRVIFAPGLSFGNRQLEIGNEM
jgi:hypothetical protein